MLLLGVLITVYSVVLQVLTLAPLVAIALSSFRLRANNYGNVGNDAANSAKLKASLQIFYSLTLAQSNAFYLWKMMVVLEKCCVSTVSKKCRFGEWGIALVWAYLEETKTIPILERAPRGRNLVTFAVGLLGSESLHDRCSALRMLDTFVGDKVPVAPSLLLPCRGPLENLMEALEVGDCETRERATRIVAALAAGDHLRRIDQFPRALHHMASLLQASGDYRFPTATTAATEEPRQAAAASISKRGRIGLLYCTILSCINLHKVFEKVRNDEDTLPSGRGPKQLISQGLLIVERLALHRANRAHMCNNKVLLSKLTAPLCSSHAFFLDTTAGTAVQTTEWVDMLATSLRIITRLVRAPGEASRGLRDGIASNAQAISNLSRVLEKDDDNNSFGPALKAAAVDILAELALPSSDRSAASRSRLGKADIIRGLWCIFLVQVDGGVDGSKTQGDEEQRQQDSTLRKKASEALAQMLSAELRHVAGLAGLLTCWLKVRALQVELGQQEPSSACVHIFLQNMDNLQGRTMRLRC
jgi:hypothetical protein